MAEPAAWAPLRWAAPTTLVLTAFGFAVSAYLTYAHFTTAAALACSDSGTINCAKVTTSPESYLFGIPVAVLGLVYFAGMAVANLPQMWRRPEPLVRYGRVAANGVGVLMVLWLVYAELFRIDAICIWCTVVHALTVAMFAVTAIATAWTPIGYDEDDDEDLEPVDA